MRTVLFAAAGSLFLAFAAHAADTPQVDDTRAADTQPATSQALPPVSAAGSTCIDTATVSRTAYSTDDDAENDSGTCSQFLSTQTLVQPRPAGRT